MKIMVKANTHDEYYDGGPDIAVIELTKEGIENILSKCETAQGLEDKDSSFYKLEYFGWCPDWIDNDELPEDIAQRIEDEEAVVIADNPTGQEIRMECVVLNVKPTGIFWSGYIKHSNVCSETVEISVDELQELKEAA